MTRETKIGLLVGLAFIIVIGILLSDHVQRTTEPQQADMTGAGDNVRQAVTVPGASTAMTNTPTVTPPPVTPVQPVPTPEELQPKPTPPTPPAPPVVQVEVGGPSQSTPPVEIQRTPAPAPTPQVGETMPLRPIPGAVAHNDQPEADDLVSGRTTPAPTSNHREYKAVSGDTLAKIAAKLMGKNTESNRQAIVDANPSLKAAPNKITVGKTYLIPVAASETGHAVTTLAAAPPSPTTKPATTAEPEHYYIVKERDTLWRIAAEQVGDPKAIASIKELNRDVLKGSDALKPNMKLRLPAKPLASAR